ncbi:MAG: GNAT family N-acetyltransferase [Nanoarchaeota archaeon]
MINIRRATLPDAKALASLDALARREMRVWALQKEKDFVHSLNKKDSYFLIALEGKSFVGYIETEFDAPKEIVWIKNIFVIKKYRKKKIARQMIQQITHYWKKNTKLIVLLTADRNLKIFNKLGFRKTMNYLVQEI